MRAIILAAGVGRRLNLDGTGDPKVLLPFAGRSLLRRHVEILEYCGVEEIVVAVGYRADLIEAELARIASGERVEMMFNPDYQEGSILTLWSVRDALTRGGDVILMDGDVLYDHRIMERLLASPHGNCFLLDRNFEPGDEPTKLCIRDGELVEFHKNVSVEFDYWGESVGFFRLREDVARRLVDGARSYIDRGARRELYDEALRDILIGDPPGAFGVEDITGLPWTEIDFAEDVTRAEAGILPRLVEPAGQDAPLLVAAQSG